MGKEVIISYWEFRRTLKNSIAMADNEINLLKLICLVETIQRTDFTSAWEDNFLKEIY